MKKIALLGIVAVLYANLAFAATLTVGGQEISYQVPPGYVSTDGNPRLVETLSIIKRLQFPGLEILAAYFPASAIDRFEQDGVLERYLLIVIDRRIEGELLDPRDFADFKETMREQFGAAARAARVQVNELLEKASGDMRLGAMAPLEFYAESETAISCLMLLYSQFNLGGPLVSSRQAVVSTSFLSGGKLLTVNQYQAVSSGDDVEAFRDSAQEPLADMAFPQGSAGIIQDILGGGRMGRAVWGGLKGAVIGALIGLLVAYVFKQVKVRKKNDAAE